MNTKYFKLQTKRKLIDDGGASIIIKANAMKDSLIDFSVDSNNGFAYGALSIAETKQLISILQNVIKEAMKT